MLDGRMAQRILPIIGRTSAMGGYIMKTFAAVLLGATAFLSVGAAYAADLVVGVS